MPAKVGTREPKQQLIFGYTRVSTDEQVNGYGLEAQRDTIEQATLARGWTVEHFADEGVSGKSIGPNLQEVLQLLAAGQGDGLVVAKLDRLSRSIVNASNIIESAQRQGWSLVILDLGVDLTTAAGRMQAMMLVNFAQYERELISERTRSALAAKKRRGEPIGRPRVASPSVVRRIVKLRNAGNTYDAIASVLTAENLLSPLGKPSWQPSTVRRIYNSATAEQVTA
ncbi:recombinase family protein [Mycobacteroides abscessus]|uniref:recombinase family protein n=1 Tax=Mycobacteroides abscessus TaxID=36809 RepID=UPI000C2632B7|nr:recombinase family protein [Mycobacteroides abscessus]